MLVVVAVVVVVVVVVAAKVGSPPAATYHCLARCRLYCSEIGNIFVRFDKWRV